MDIAHTNIYQFKRRSIVSGLILPLSFVSVVLISSRNVLNFTLPAPLNSLSCSSGLRSVFCTLSSSLYCVIVVPFTLNPLPSLPAPSGSITFATYLPSLRVLQLNTQTSLAPIISVGLMLTILNLSSCFLYFSLATNLSALLG